MEEKVAEWLQTWDEQPNGRESGRMSIDLNWDEQPNGRESGRMSIDLNWDEQPNGRESGRMSTDLSSLMEEKVAECQQSSGVDETQITPVVRHTTFSARLCPPH